MYDANARSWAALRLPCATTDEAYAFLKEHMIDYTDIDNQRHFFN